MENNPENLDSQAPTPTRGSAVNNWLPNASIVVIFLLASYIVLGHGLKLFDAIAANLPLLLPLVVTVLSIFTRARDIRTLDSVLKMSNDIAIGIISFDIWAISASRSDPVGRILVNPNTMISGEFVLPFLLAGLIIAVGCLVLTQLDIKDSRNKTRWLGIAFAASVLVYVAPFGVTQPVQAGPSQALQMRQYTVAIPYQDPVIISFAPTYLRDRQFLRVEKNVAATSPSDARSVGLRRFLESTDSDQVKMKSKSKSDDTKVEKVSVRPEDILVIER